METIKKIDNDKYVTFLDVRDLNKNGSKGISIPSKLTKLLDLKKGKYRTTIMKNETNKWIISVVLDDLL